MKRIMAAVVGIGLIAGQAYAADKLELKEQKDKVSYSIGIDIGTNLKNAGVDVDQEILAKGIKDGLSGNSPAMTKEEMQQALMDLQKEMVAKQTERMKVLAEKNKKEGDAFLAENKSKEGVKTLPSGLQYKVVTEGTGPKPKPTDTVTVNYRGTLVDGTEFDSSYKRGQPATFPVNGVIPGWTEALQLMPTGSKWQLFIPANLAYGERGAGQNIGPNATLIFDVELLAVKEQSKDMGMPPGHPHTGEPAKEKSAGPKKETKKK
jgi:FKBP-type peptidyl-prolyl cis-trans isomerase FklB